MLQLFKDTFVVKGAFSPEFHVCIMAPQARVHGFRFRLSLVRVTPQCWDICEGKPLSSSFISDRRCSLSVQKRLCLVLCQQDSCTSELGNAKVWHNDSSNRPGLRVWTSVTNIMRPHDPCHVYVHGACLTCMSTVMSVVCFKFGINCCMHAQIL